MAYSACPTPAQGTARDSVEVRGIIRVIIERINALLDRATQQVALRRDRDILVSLSDEQLRDIGITRADAEEEYRKSSRLL